MIDLEVLDFERTGEIISHGIARTIAAGYSDHNTVSFVTTGNLPAPNAEEEETAEEVVDQLMRDIVRGVDVATMAKHVREIDALRAYLKWRASVSFYGPVNGWAMLAG